MARLKGTRQVGHGGHSGGIGPVAVARRSGA